MRAIHGTWPGALLLVGLAAFTAAAGEPAVDAARIEFFEKRIRPILIGNCYNCHSANTNAKGGLRVDDRHGLVSGGGRGAAIVPGDPEASLLIRVVRQEGKVPKMPAEGAKLSPEQIADLAEWIKEGAAWPQVELPAEVGKSSADYEHLRKTHWAWQPLSNAKPPEVRDASWVRDDIDRFILAGLEAKELQPVADADKPTLIRRVTFDLIGLPPTPQQVDAFVADESAEAFKKVVNRLLASPAFGERFHQFSDRAVPVFCLEIRDDRVSNDKFFEFHRTYACCAVLLLLRLFSLCAAADDSFVKARFAQLR